ncbi:NIPSNAP family protein [Flavisphingomonas formosensis]|uniref:NIPSNAP family protein n=1 Tax=Flavisphingomonas formosensis TaxID=861534 RepID=UPI0012FBBCC3|nr:NIPSNAP family protein [Sphingomonas formosensis]
MGAYYIQTDVLLKLGRNEGYAEMMEKLVPTMASHGWKLIMALQPMVGDFRKLTHLWEVDAFDDIRRGLEACAADPEVQAILAPMPDLLETEALTVMVKTPYAP